MNAREFLDKHQISQARYDIRSCSHLVDLLEEFAAMRVEEFKQLSTKPPHEKKISPSMLNEFGLVINVGGAPMDVVCHNQVQLELVDALTGFLKHKGDASFLVNHLNKIRT